MDYTQFYCYECKFCMFDVFGRVICLSKDTTTGYYSTACSSFDDRYATNDENINLLARL